VAGEILAPSRGREPALLGEGVAIGPCRLLQVEGAAMADAAAVGAGEAATIKELRRQPRWVETAKRRLRVGGIEQPEGADAAVAPRLPLEPNERVEAVLGLAQIFREMAARMIAAAAVLIGDPRSLRRRKNGARGERHVLVGRGVRRHARR